MRPLPRTNRVIRVVISTSKISATCYYAFGNTFRVAFFVLQAQQIVNMRINAAIKNSSNEILREFHASKYVETYNYAFFLWK